MGKISCNHREWGKTFGDEFYTLPETVEAEVPLYFRSLKGKTVYCPCDNPYYSAFVRFFLANFRALGLRKLLSTNFRQTSVQLDLFSGAPEVNPVLSTAYRMEITRVPAYRGKASIDDLCSIEGNSIRRLDGDGSWSSLECRPLWEEADLIITNPPFSEVDKIMLRALADKKDFLLIAPYLNLTHKLIWPHYMEKRLRLGKNWGYHTTFALPDGSRMIVGCVGWITTLNPFWVPPFLPLTARYRGYESRYPFYDEAYRNQRVIDVPKVTDIPLDWQGPMGVSLNILPVLCPQQFKVLGLLNNGGKVPYDFFKPTVQGQLSFVRILVQRTPASYL